jgi:hypothetical protein
MYHTEEFVYNTSPSGSSHYGFSPMGANTFAKPSPNQRSIRSVNSSPSVVYLGTSSPDNPAHQNLKNRNIAVCPVIGNSDGNPEETDEGVRCSYDYDDFQEVSDLQTYADSFGQDEGFHETMREFCQRPSRSCFGGDTPDSKSNLCTNLTSVGEVGDVCRNWATQNPEYAPVSRGYESGGSWEKTSFSSRKSNVSGKSGRSHNSNRSDRSKTSNRSDRSGKSHHDNDGISLSVWFFILVIVILIIMAAVYMDYRRRYRSL